MPDLQPLYTPENCQFAAPLQWSVAIFWRERETSIDWLPSLTAALQPDCIRVLSHHFACPTTSQFAISTLPHVSPMTIVQRTKGRLSHLVRDRKPKPFKGNFSIRSIGNVTRTAVESYVAEQLGHHKMADAEVQQRLEQYQIIDNSVDVSQMQKTSHGVYWYNLHLVFVHRERWNEVRDPVLSEIRSMVMRVARKYSFRLARAGILPDHLHLVLGCPFAATPAEVALRFLNNLAFVHGMTPIYQYGGYVGTVGEYTNKAF